MAKTLEDFMKGGYEQIEWPEDGIVNAQYLGQEIVATQYGDRVKLAVYDLRALNETAIYTTSAKLLNQLFNVLKLQVNDKVAIKKEGEGFKTKYTAAIITRAGEPDANPVAVTAANTAPVIDPSGDKVHPF